MVLNEMGEVIITDDDDEEERGGGGCGEGEEGEEPEEEMGAKSIERKSIKNKIPNEFRDRCNEILA